MFGQRPVKYTDQRLSDKAMVQSIDEFWRNTDLDTRLHFDIAPNHASSRYATVAHSPKVRGQVRSRRLFELLEFGHIDAVVLQNAPIQTLSWFIADQYEADSIQVDLPTSQFATASNNFGLELVLRDLLALDKSEHIAKPAKYFRVTRTIVRQHKDFKFLFDAKLANFTRFKHGEVFGLDGDKPLMAKNDGEAILYPNGNVTVGDIAALMVYDVIPRFEDDQLVYD